MTRFAVVRSAALIAAAIATALLSGCGAGQDTQTSMQQSAVTGVNGDSPDGRIGLRDVQVVYRDPAGYPKGGSAALSVRITNSSPNAVRLTGVTAQGWGSVSISGGASASASASPSGAPSPSAGGPSPSAVTPTPSASASAQPSPSISASASPSASAASPSTSQSSSAAGNAQINESIPAGAVVVLDPQGGGRYLQISGLSQDLRPGSTVPLTFTFDNGVSISLNVPFGLPLTPLPRSSLSLQPSEG